MLALLLLLLHADHVQSPDGWPSNGVPAYATFDTVKNSYEQNTKKVLNLTGCLSGTAADQIGCLGKFSGFDLANLTENVNTVVVDGTYLTYPLLVVNNTEGSYATDVGVMVGFNRDETAINVGVGDQPQGNATFTQYFDAQVGPKFSMNNAASSGFLTKIMADNPQLIPEHGTPDQIFNATMRVSADCVFKCFTLAKTYSGAKSGAFKKAYSFMFNRTMSPSGYTRP